MRTKRTFCVIGSLRIKNKLAAPKSHFGMTIAGCGLDAVSKRGELGQLVGVDDAPVAQT